MGAGSPAGPILPRLPGGSESPEIRPAQPATAGPAGGCPGRGGGSGGDPRASPPRAPAASPRREPGVQHRRAQRSGRPAWRARRVPAPQGWPRRVLGSRWAIAGRHPLPPAAARRERKSGEEAGPPRGRKGTSAERPRARGRGSRRARTGRGTPGRGRLRLPGPRTRLARPAIRPATSRTSSARKTPPGLAASLG